MNLIIYVFLNTKSNTRMHAQTWGENMKNTE